MGPSPSWTPLLNLRLMAHYPSLCTGNLHTLTSTCSGIVTITPQPHLVSPTPSPIGTPQCVASLSCSNRKRTTLGGLSLDAGILNELWTRWREDLAGLPARSLMGPTTKALQLPNLSLMQLKIRVILSCPTCKVFVKVSKRSVVGAFRPTLGERTIRSLLVSLKGRNPVVNQSGAIYWYQCGDLGCDEEYMGETSRTFGERYKEHLKAPSAIHHHSSQTGHPTSHNNFQIIGREGHNLARNIKESIYIRVNNPTLNNNIGKFNLPHIWDKVILNTKGLHLKRQVNNNNTQHN